MAQDTRRVDRQGGRCRRPGDRNALQRGFAQRTRATDSHGSVRYGAGRRSACASHDENGARGKRVDVGIVARGVQAGGAHMSENGSTAMVKRIGDPAPPMIDPRTAVAARNLDDVHRMAMAVAKSGLYGVQSVEEAEIRMITGMELGLSMLQSIRGVYVINTGGRKLPGLYADMMAGVCKSHPETCEYFRLVDSTPLKAIYATKRVGEPSETVMSFTMDDAQAAALARAVYPDLLNGLYCTEELQDMRNAPPMPMPIRTELLTADGEIVQSSPELDEQLHASLEQAQKKLFDGLMVDLLDAMSPDMLDKAMAAVGAGKDKLSSDQLTQLRVCAKAMKAQVSG